MWLSFRKQADAITLIRNSRLRNIEVGLSSLALYEANSLRTCPGALCFVRYNYLFGWNLVVSSVLVSEMMDVLNEVAHFELGSLFCDVLAVDCVAKEGFSLRTSTSGPFVCIYTFLLW